jgi:hypothetical protein
MKRVFYGILVLLLCLSPFFYADMLVMVPSALVFVSAAGAMNAVSRIKPTCLRCGGEVTSLATAVTN